MTVKSAFTVDYVFVHSQKVKMNRPFSVDLQSSTKHIVENEMGKNVDF